MQIDLERISKIDHGFEIPQYSQSAGENQPGARTKVDKHFRQGALCWRACHQTPARNPYQPTQTRLPASLLQNFGCSESLEIISKHNQNAAEHRNSKYDESPSWILTFRHYLQQNLRRHPAGSCSIRSKSSSSALRNLVFACFHPALYAASSLPLDDTSGRMLNRLTCQCTTKEWRTTRIGEESLFLREHSSPPHPS